MKEIERVVWKANVSQRCEEKLLGDGGKGRGEVQKDASPLWLSERSDHGRRIDLEEVGEDGTAA